MQNIHLSIYHINTETREFAKQCKSLSEFYEKCENITILFDIALAVSVPQNLISKVLLSFVNTFRHQIDSEVQKLLLIAFSYNKGEIDSKKAKELRIELMDKLPTPNKYEDRLAQEIVSYILYEGGANLNSLPHYLLIESQNITDLSNDYRKDLALENSFQGTSKEKIKYFMQHYYDKGEKEFVKKFKEIISKELFLQSVQTNTIHLI